MTQPIWNTPRGDLGSFPAAVDTTVRLSASPMLPATSLIYILLSGSLPIGLTMTPDGVISGLPGILSAKEPSTFTVRVTDNLGGIHDRTFSMRVSGTLVPKFITPAGNLFSGFILDDVWVDFPIQYDDPYPTTPATITLKEGGLPLGLEMNSVGRIRGYPQPPTIPLTESDVTVYAVTTNSTENTITLSGSYSTNSFTIGRPVIFYGAVFGNILTNVTYYIKSVIDHLTFTISQSQDGPTFQLISASGNMTVELPMVSVNTPTTRTYSFLLLLSGSSGSSTSTFSITVKNQNLSVNNGGTGTMDKVRSPVVLNSRPLSYTITDEYQGYYQPTGETSIDIGAIKSDEYFSYKIIGYDFESSPIAYNYSSLPLGLVGDSTTGWITGTPHVSPGIYQYPFSVSVWKSDNHVLASETFTLTFTISNEVVSTIVWITDSDLGTILNGSMSNLVIQTKASMPLTYTITSGILPPGLSLMADGEITGYVSYQPSTTVLPVGHITTYQFTVEARSVDHSIVFSDKTFVLNVIQEYRFPTDDIYIKAAPELADRATINSLLTDTTLIPDVMLYRPTDIYFGKANSVKYGHLYGVISNRVDEYLAATNTHHYWRNITLGSIKTAVARNASGEIVYEVVYSEVIDNLKINEPAESPLFEDVEKNYVYWPVPVNGQRMLYPNSLANMRQKVADTLGQSADVRKLPLWMTSQQRNGSTLGYTAAWVICHTKPGYSETIKNNILMTLTSTITQTTSVSNVIRGLTTSFYYNMPVMFSSSAGNLQTGVTYYIRDIINTNSFTVSDVIDGPVFTLTDSLPTGMTMVKRAWNGMLNTINFTLDRFTVDKSRTYNYASNPPSWAELPGAIPAPNPIDSKDFHVLFTRKTILPE